jgi:hypothetical protein
MESPDIKARVARLANFISPQSNPSKRSSNHISDLEFEVKRSRTEAIDIGGEAPQPADEAAASSNSASDSLSQDRTDSASNSVAGLRGFKDIYLSDQDESQQMSPASEPTTFTEHVLSPLFHSPLCLVFDC